LNDSRAYWPLLHAETHDQRRPQVDYISWLDGYYILFLLDFIGVQLSTASWEPIPGGPLYTAAKHGVLGFMRSIYPSCHSQGIRVATIHPWFANTALVPTIVKVFLAGIPLTPIERVAGAIVCAATDPHMETSGCTWLLPDGGYVFRLEREQLKEGVYRIIDARVKAAVM
jgi:hypothetical protein